MVLIVDVVCEFCIEVVYCICDCGLCVFCCELKGVEKSVLGGGTMNFCRPARRPTKIHAGRPSYLRGHVEADENKAPYFRRPRWPMKIPRRAPIFVGLGGTDENKSFTSVPTKIFAHFRRIYFWRLFSSAYAYFSGFLAHENLCVSCSGAKPTSKREGTTQCCSLHQHDKTCHHQTTFVSRVRC
jgi:hypothetical protein